MPDIFWYVARMLTITVMKIEAARIQLDRAARLFYCEGDLVSAQTLASAAHGILGDLVTHRGDAEPGFYGMLRAHKGNPVADRAHDEMRQPMNFLKHARDDPGESLSLHEQRVEFEIIIATVLLNDLCRREMTPVLQLVFAAATHRFVGLPKEYQHLAVAKTDPAWFTREAIGGMIVALERQGTASEPDGVGDAHLR